MNLISLKCLECSAELAKLNAPALKKVTGDSSIICVPCAEKIKKARK